MSLNRLATAAVLALLVAPFAVPAQAQETIHTSFSHAAASCQAALPVFDGAIRKRPRAIANEGTSNAFISCGFENTPNATRGVISVRIDFYNPSTTAATIGCTLVDGFRTTDFSPAQTRSVTVPAGESDFFEWYAPNNDNGFNYTLPALSCLLPPGTEINGTRMEFLDATER